MNNILISGRLTKVAELGYIAVTGTPKSTFTLHYDNNILHSFLYL